MGSTRPGYSGIAGGNLRMRFTAAGELGESRSAEPSIAHLYFMTNHDTHRQQRPQREQVPRDGVAEAVVVDVDAG